MKYFVFALFIAAAVAIPADVAELKEFRADHALPEAWDFA